MAHIGDLREIIATKVAAYQARVEEAKLGLEMAVQGYHLAERALSEVEASAQKSLDAIALVEAMLTEADYVGKVLPYQGENQEEAMRMALGRAGRSLNSTELADALKQGGYQFTSANPANSIVVAANTNRKGYFTTEKDGHRTLIGLKAWPPVGAAEDPEEIERWFDNTATA